MKNSISQTVPKSVGAKINYVALGDSYTICEGATPQESWPNILTNHLKEKGINIELVANTAHTGYTTQNLIDAELPIAKKSQPTFATLLIGVNDWARGMDNAGFAKRFIQILDSVQKMLPNKNNLLLITIPDFSVTPRGVNYANGRNIANGLQQYNEIIKTEAKIRNLNLIDIFSLSQKMLNAPELVAEDGLHPSAKEYALWEELIFPVAFEMLKKQK